jgi:predicted DNA-binding transcriptional regulator AlpA
MAVSPSDFDLLSDEDVARATGNSTITLARWRRQGIGPRFVKLGRKVWYPREALADWIKAREAKSTAEARQRIERHVISAPSTRWLKEKEGQS